MCFRVFFGWLVESNTSTHLHTLTHIRSHRLHKVEHTNLFGTNRFKLIKLWVTLTVIVTNISFDTRAYFIDDIFFFIYKYIDIYCSFKIVYDLKAFINSTERKKSRKKRAITLKWCICICEKKNRTTKTVSQMIRWNEWFYWKVVSGFSMNYYCKNEFCFSFSQLYFTIIWNIYIECMAMISLRMPYTCGSSISKLKRLNIRCVSRAHSDMHSIFHVQCFDFRLLTFSNFTFSVLTISL